MKNLLLTAAALLTLSATGAMAQVTIGSTANPQPFSILELDGGGTRGLRLPQLTTAERDALILAGNAAAQGLQIFNTTTECIDTWNGAKWIKQCSDYVKMPVPTGCTTPPLPVRFARHNLGADPSLDTPKKQMKYLAEHAFYKLDARVYGGLYQWGHKNHAHAVNASDFTRYDGSTNATAGQTDNPDAPEFYYSSNSNWYNGTDADKLWGNGVAVATATSPYGVPLYSGSDVTGYYQKPVKTVNDPCPPGFRVPTQDEWERVCNYGCNSPNSAGGYFDTSASGTLGNGTKGTGKGLTWIPVVCNGTSAQGKCVPSNYWLSGTSSGYAVYNTGDWEAAISAGGVYEGFDGANFPSGKSLHDAGAAVPEPLLFIPAAGYRNYSDGTVNNTGFDGNYWSSTVEGTENAYDLNFYKAAASSNNSIRRAHGFSVRCVYDETSDN
jgi:hypothetical protein